MAWFTFADASEEIFVVRIDDPDAVAHARGLIAGTVTSESLVAGIVVAAPASYNIGWSYHLDPASIFFFEFSIEVGDATMRYIEEHLDEVGGAFLPGSRWTPWTSALVDELQAQFGESGTDLLQGSREADLLFGKAGDDCLFGAAGDDHLVAGTGADRAFGGLGDDKLGGGSGRDSLWGGAGGDVLAGDGGADRLLGGAGNDSLLGGNGRDILRGGSGADTLEGGTGPDLLTGGVGWDSFKLTSMQQSGPAVHQRDIIADFMKGRDRIDLSAIDPDLTLDDDQAFSFIWMGQFTASGQVRFEVVNGITTVFVNADRDSEAELAIDLIGSIELGVGDFVL